MLDGDPAPPPPKRGRSPQIFGPCLLWPNGWVDQDGTWHGDRPQLRRVCVRLRPSHPPKKGAEPPPQFSAHFYCVQTAGCIKMPLGMEVCLSPGNFVLRGEPAPSPKRGQSPQIFGPCLLWPNGWMDQDATWCAGRPRPRRLCVVLLSLPKKGTDPPHKFSAYVYCGQMAGWIMIILGMEVGLSPVD